jgi:hypothetical protein
VWQTPTVVPQLASAYNDRDVTLTADRLEMYFRSERPSASGTDIWMTTRATIADSWNAPVPATDLNSKSTELTPEVSADGLTIWISTDRPGPRTAGDFDIWVSTRASRGAAWRAPASVPEVNSPGVDFGATPFPNLLTMMLTSSRTGGLGGDDIYLSTRPSLASPWGSPVPVSELCTAANDSGAYPVDPDNIYLSSKSTGDQELFVSRRASSADPFGAPVRITELSSPSSEEAPWVSADERDIFFSSDRTGVYQIYESKR